MDTSDPDITFNELGVCKHCTTYDINLPLRTWQGDEAKKQLSNIVAKIKKAGESNDYDCIIGVSGGVDSTYVAYIVKELGLRPLAIHFDNGWNSELAVNNIQKTLQTLNIDLYTHVIDWEEFKSLQISFLRASTPDGEVPTDHAINALLFKEAAKHKIKYIINGMNYASESLSVPSWAYGHSDWKYIKSVHKLFSNTPLNNYPYYTFLRLFYITYIKRVKSISILNFINYTKNEAMDVLQNKLGWIYYGGKHYESVYTRFFQGYILPKKFNIDKRRGHLSDLVKSNQLTREQALEEIKKPAMDTLMEAQDKEYVIKKFGFTENEFEQILNLPKKTFRDYPNNYNMVMQLKKIVNLLRQKKLYSK